MSKIKQKASKIPDLKTVGGVNRTKAVPGTIYFVPGTKLSHFWPNIVYKVQFPTYNKLSC